MKRLQFEDTIILPRRRFWRVSADCGMDHDMIAYEIREPRWYGSKLVVMAVARMDEYTQRTHAELTQQALSKMARYDLAAAAVARRRR